MKKLGVYVIIGIILLVLINLVAFNLFNEGDKLIKVGVILALSGSQSYSGLEMQKGLEMCNPGNIEYIYEDSAGVATTGVTAYNKLTKMDNVDLTIVGMSTVVPAILPLAKEQKDFVITTIVTASDVAKRGGDTVFRFYIDGKKAASLIAGYMIKDNAKKVGILYVQNEFGQTYLDSAKSFLELNNISVYTDSFQITDLDFSTQISKLKSNNVTHILVIAYDKQTLQVISKIKELGINANVFSAWMWQDKDYTNNKNILEGTYTTRSAYLSSSTTEAINFNEEFKLKFNSEGNQFSAIGCDLSQIIGNNKIKNPTQLGGIKEFNGINGKIVPEEPREFNFPLKIVQFSEGITNEFK